MDINVTTKQKNYIVHIEKGILDRLSCFLKPDRYYYVVSENGVPKLWQDKVLSQLKNAKLFLFEQGEANKNINTYLKIQEWLIENNASRKDVLIALGGGVTGDLGGFVASSYKRGITFINIPTTLLSQVDASVGGKTAIDVNGIKNIIGAFYQPEAVFIDPEVLSTLSPRQLSNGMAEAIKMGLICDEKLFEVFETQESHEHLEEIICRSIKAKTKVVEADENENGLRKILNFGHTLGHAYETASKGKYLHGECVAMGMMQILENKEIKKRLEKVLRKEMLPISYDGDNEELYALILNDKKGNHDHIDVVLLDEIGKPRIETIGINKLKEVLK